MAGGRGVAGYIYVLRQANGEFKIGKAQDVGRRFYKMFFGMGGKFSDPTPNPRSPHRVCLTVPVSKSLSSKIEVRALGYLQEHFGRGTESFPCTEDQAIAAVRLAVALIETNVDK